MSSFALKIIACISMCFDHFGYLIYNGKLSFCNFIGRLAFPIFAFQISEGYTHTKSLKKYFFRLAIFALISQIPYALFHSIISDNFSLNIFFTLFIGLCCIYIYDKVSNKFLSLSLCIILAIFANIIHTDYGFFGVSIILLFFIFKGNPVLRNIAFIVATIIKYSINILMYGNAFVYLLLAICTISSIVVIDAYNGTQGRKIRYLLYVFYPLHLFVIYLLWRLL